MMFTYPVGIKTELVSIDNLIKELFVKGSNRARTIFVIIQYREYAKALRFLPPSELVNFLSSDDWLPGRNPYHRPL